jgi:hypothetical protein
MTIDRTDASAALAAMRETRRKFGQSLQCGWGYSFAFGAMMGWLIAMQGVPLPWRFLGFVPFFGVFPLMIRWQRRSTHRFINGYRRGRTRWVALAMVAVFLALYALATVLALDHQAAWAPFVLGLVAIPLGAVGNRMWIKAYNADLEAGQ